MGISNLGPYRGGSLKVSYTKKGDRYEDIWLTDGDFVFDGEINLVDMSFNVRVYGILIDASDRFW